MKPHHRFFLLRVDAVPDDVFRFFVLIKDRDDSAIRESIPAVIDDAGLPECGSQYLVFVGDVDDGSVGKPDTV